MATEDSKFGVALHALSLLAHRQAPVPSDLIATSIGTHPTWVRESAGALRAAGLVTSVRGPGGGLVLARPATQITLAEIWRATSGPDPQPARLATTPSSRCRVGRAMEDNLRALSRRMVSATERELAETTLAQWVDRLERDTAG